MKRQDLLLFAIFTFIIILAWTGFSLYHTFKVSTLTSIQQSEIKPITPDFDMVTIQKLRERKSITPLMTAPANSVKATSSAQVQPTILLSPSPSFIQKPPGSSSGTLLRGQ